MRFFNFKSLDFSFREISKQTVIETHVSGSGSYLPDRIVTNDDLSKIVDTSDEWIKTRTGISERRFASDAQSTSDLAVEAARDALADAGLTVQDVGMIVVATVTPDKTFPATAVYVQQKLGCPPGIAFDVSAACAGFLHALNVAHNFVSMGQVKHALVIGADKLSCFLDFTDRSSCVLFGDGAGALVLSGQEADESPIGKRKGILNCHLTADGSGASYLHTTGGPSTTGTVGKVEMNGKEIFRNAVENISNAVQTVIDQSNISPDDVDWFVPHQANIRIIHGCSRKLGLPDEKIIVTIDKHGNTSSASIPLAFAKAHRDGRIKPGQLIVTAALGGGLAWGSAAIRL